MAVSVMDDLCMVTASYKQLPSLMPCFLLMPNYNNVLNCCKCVGYNDYNKCMAH